MNICCWHSHKESLIHKMTHVKRKNFGTSSVIPTCFFFLWHIFFCQTTCLVSIKLLSGAKWTAIPGFLAALPHFSVTPFQRFSASFNQHILLINAAQERKAFGERCQAINCGRKTKDGTIESKLQIAIWSDFEFSWRLDGAYLLQCHTLPPQLKFLLWFRNLVETSNVCMI